MSSFAVNGFYRNRQQWYKVLEIKGNCAKIEFEDGTVRWEDDLHILLRIWDNILREKPYETRQQKKYLEQQSAGKDGWYENIKIRKKPEARPKPRQYPDSVKQYDFSEKGLIFASDKVIEIDDGMYSAGYYHPYRSGNQELNPEFDRWSSCILDLKNRSERAINFFYGILTPQLREGFPIACVPSHEPSTSVSGTVLLAQRLTRDNRIDATSCLIRHKRIEKLSSGGDRSASLHMQTIKIENQHLIQDKAVLLLDDVYTTGNSLRACRKLLVQAGAGSVYCLVLGKTVRSKL